jgi:KUP system potassium uptake protein
LNGIWPSSQPAPSEEDVIGGISAIIWAFTLLPLLKYVNLKSLDCPDFANRLCQVFISLYFGTSEGELFIIRLFFLLNFVTTGEGGSFALFQALYPPKEQNLDEDRTLTGESNFGKPGVATFRQKARWPLLLWVSICGVPYIYMYICLQHRFFSVCLVLREYFQQNFQIRLTEFPSLTMADGVFTPAVSVTSAVGGIAVAKPSVSKDIIPISIVGIQSINFLDSS